MIKISVLACSSIAKRSVIPAIINSGRFRLMNIASRNIEKAEECAQIFNCNACNYEELLKTDDDAVYVSLPVGLHYEWVMRLLEAGKHVLVEKTFVDEKEKADKIVDYANLKHLVAMEALVYLYHPLHKKVISLINSGAIGEVKHIEAYFGFPFLPQTDIRNQFDLGGGAMLDALIYPLSFALDIMKDRSLCSYFGKIIRDENQPVDTSGFLQLNWKSVVAQIGYGFGFSYRNDYKVWGNQGILSAERVFSRPPTFKGDILVTNKDGNRVIEVEQADHFVNMLGAFADKIENKNNSIDDTNTGTNITDRLSIIGNLRQHFIKESYKTVEVFKQF